MLNIMYGQKIIIINAKVVKEMFNSVGWSIA